MNKCYIGLVLIFMLIVVAYQTSYAVSITDIGIPYTAQTETSNADDGINDYYVYASPKEGKAAVYSAVLQNFPADDILPLLKKVDDSAIVHGEDYDGTLWGETQKASVFIVDEYGYAGFYTQRAQRIMNLLPYLQNEQFYRKEPYATSNCYDAYTLANMQKTLPFCTPDDARTLADGALDAVGVPSQYRRYVRTYSLSYEDMQTFHEELENENEGYKMELADTGINSIWTEKDDAYLLIYTFALDGIPIVAIDTELLDERIINGMTATFLVTDHGIEYMELLHCYTIDNDSALFQDILTSERASECFHAKIQEVILDNEPLVGDIWMTYLPVPGANTMTNVQLTPAWCVEAKYSINREEQHIERSVLYYFNAVTGREIR